MIFEDALIVEWADELENNIKVHEIDKKSWVVFHPDPGYTVACDLVSWTQHTEDGDDGEVAVVYWSREVPEWLPIFGGRTDIGRILKELRAALTSHKA